MRRLWCLLVLSRATSLVIPSPPTCRVSSVSQPRFVFSTVAVDHIEGEESSSLLPFSGEAPNHDILPKNGDSSNTSKTGSLWRWRNKSRKVFWSVCWKLFWPIWKLSWIVGNVFRSLCVGGLPYTCIDAATSSSTNSHDNDSSTTPMARSQAAVYAALEEEKEALLLGHHDDDSLVKTIKPLVQQHCQGFCALRAELCNMTLQSAALLSQDQAEDDVLADDDQNDFAIKRYFWNSTSLFSTSKRLKETKPEQLQELHALVDKTNRNTLRKLMDLEIQALCEQIARRYAHAVWSVATALVQQSGCRRPKEEEEEAVLFSTSQSATLLLLQSVFGDKKRSKELLQYSEIESCQSLFHIILQDEIAQQDDDEIATILAEAARETVKNDQDEGLSGLSAQLSRIFKAMFVTSWDAFQDRRDAGEQHSGQLVDPVGRKGLPCVAPEDTTSTIEQEHVHETTVDQLIEAGVTFARQQDQQTETEDDKLAAVVVENQIRMAQDRTDAAKQSQAASLIDDRIAQALDQQVRELNTTLETHLASLVEDRIAKALAQMDRLRAEQDRQELAALVDDRIAKAQDQQTAEPNVERDRQLATLIDARIAEAQNQQATKLEAERESQFIALVDKRIAETRDHQRSELNALRDHQLATLKAQDQQMAELVAEQDRKLAALVDGRITNAWEQQMAELRTAQDKLANLFDERIAKAQDEQVAELIKMNSQLQARVTELGDKLESVVRLVGGGANRSQRRAKFGASFNQPPHLYGVKKKNNSKLNGVVVRRGHY